MEKITPISEVRNNLPELVNELKKNKSHLIITRNGKPAAVLMSAEEFETLEILSDSKLVKSLIRAEEDVRKGRLVPEDEG